MPAGNCRPGGAPWCRIPRSTGRGRFVGGAGDRTLHWPRRLCPAAGRRRPARNYRPEKRLRRTADRRLRSRCDSVAPVRQKAVRVRPPRSFRRPWDLAAGRKPTAGIKSRLASISRLPKLCVNVPSSASKPFSQTVWWIASRTPRQRSKRRFITVFLHIPNGAIERDPCHDFRVGEVATAASYFPDSVIGIHPDPFQVLQCQALKRPCGSQEKPGRLRRPGGARRPFLPRRRVGTGPKPRFRS